MSNSDEHDVTLLNVSRELSGIYKCEVSEDMPTYHTAMKEQRMDIAGKNKFLFTNKCLIKTILLSI